MKKCPYCAEEIRDEAIKCKHCQSMLGEEKAPIDVKNPRAGKDFQLFGILLVIVGIFLATNESLTPVGIIIAIIGGVLYFLGRFSHWYHWE